MEENIYQAFLKAQQDAKNPPLDSTNPYFKSRYASLSAVLDSIRPALFNNGFFLRQNVHTENDCIVVTTGAVYAKTGETISGTTISYPMPKNSDNLAQDIGKIITYLRRYSLITLMGIVGEEDDDAQGLTQKRPEPAKPQYKSGPKQTTGAEIMKAFRALGLDMEVLDREMAVLAKDRDRAADVYKKTKAALEGLKVEGLDQKFLEVVKKEGSFSSSPTPLQDMLKAYQDSRELFVPWLRKYGEDVPTVP